MGTFFLRLVLHPLAILFSVFATVVAIATCIRGVPF
jgi:hypothetical protein